MKLLRDLTGPELVKALERFGYVEVRQTGSHVRLETGNIMSAYRTTNRSGWVRWPASDVAAHFGLASR
jgi:chloramphenicol 3-O-phosphotransferase